MSQDQPGSPPPPRDDDASFEPGMSLPGPAWHRASMRPEGGEPEAGPGGPAETGAPPLSAAGDESPGTGATAAAAPPGERPPAPASSGPADPGGEQPAGGHLAAGVFLAAAGLSVFAGLLELLDAQRVHFPGNAIACGAAFAVLFLLAVGRRGGPSPVRGTLGVVSVLFLTACFAFAVDLGGSGGFGEHSVRIKLAAAAAVLALGEAVVGVTVPSAVASGLAVLGCEAAVLLTVAAGSPSAAQLLVAALVTAVVLMLVALRLPRLRPHPSGLAWMLGVAAVLATLAAILLVTSADGVVAAAVGFLSLALAMLAWRHRAVAPAIAAVPCLLAVEAYVVTHVTGDRNASGEAVVVIASGVVLFLLVGMGAAAVRQWSIAGGTRRILAEELLLVTTGVLAVVALGQLNQPSLPFLRGTGASGFGGVTEASPPPLRFSTFEPLPTQSAPPAFPTFPGLPSPP